MKSIFKNNGFTLIEVVLVIVIIGILSTVALKSLSISEEQRRFESTSEEMSRLSRAIVGDERLVSGGIRSDFGYVGDVGTLPGDLDDLISNPGGYSTWNGPYFKVDFNENAEDYKRDAWNELYAYTGGVTISSNGGGSAITKQFANSSSDLTSNTVTGIVRDVDLSVPGDSSSNVTITIFYPDGSGSTTSSSTTPNGSGEFTFSSSVPIGAHRLMAVNGTDTISKYVAVYPGKTIISELRFASDLWGSSGSGGGGTGEVVFEEFTEAIVGSNANSITISTPPGVSAGDLLIAAVVADGNLSSQLIPPAGGGWTEIDLSQQTGAVTLGIWWKLADNPESSSHQFSWGGVAEQAYGWIMRFTGHNPGSPINASAVAGGSSGAPECPAVTTTVTNSLILRMGGFDDDDITIDSPGLGSCTAITMDKSNSGSGTCSGGAGYLKQSAAGSSGTVSFSLTASEQYRTATVAIAPD
jgi:prepilin-type N-terminal cleavage/methylation domain-containing protein